MSAIDTLFTTRMAAEYLGLSLIAIKKNTVLEGVAIHPRLTLYTAGELDWYKAGGIGRNISHTPYPNIEQEQRRVLAQFMIGTQVAEYLGITESVVKKSRLLQHPAIRLKFPGYERIALWERSAIEYYKAHPPKPGRKSIEGYWQPYLESKPDFSPTGET